MPHKAIAQINIWQSPAFQLEMRRLQPWFSLGIRAKAKSQVSWPERDGYALNITVTAFVCPGMMVIRDLWCRELMWWRCADSSPDSEHALERWWKIESFDNRDRGLWLNITVTAFVCLGLIIPLGSLVSRADVTTMRRLQPLFIVCIRLMEKNRVSRP